MEYGINFLQKFLRDFAGDPIAGVRAVVENFLQENRKSRSGSALQMPQKAWQIANPRDVAEEQ